MESGQRRRTTRNRELRACTECRRKKLKCDRQSPCTSCRRADRPHLCVYERFPEGRESEHERRIRAEARLEHLEQLVQQLSAPDQTASNISDLAPGLDVTRQGLDEDVNVNVSRHQIPTPSPNDPIYNGATHWSAMLEDIEELRSAIAEQDEGEDTEFNLERKNDSDTSLIFGASRSLPFGSILAQFLPPRRETDRLVAAYFRAKAIAAPFLHAPHFNRLYQLFWDNPPSASPLWTSILFSILHIMTTTRCTASTNGQANNTERSGTPNRFDVAAAHCLAVGEYYRPKRFAIEALLLYAQSKCVTSSDINSDVAAILGTLVRLATNLGYHKDADSANNKLSAFEGEMRRRTWSLCVQLDVLVSFQLGLPSNVQYPTWDTKIPTNLLDSDFDENTEVLPPARPDSEPTELLFYIAKHRLMVVFEKVLRHTLSATDNAIEELERIDMEVRNVYGALPGIYKPRSMAESIADDSPIIIARLCVEFIYNKCLCVLHRAYVTRGRINSVQICCDSASQILQRFLEIYKEFQPGGQLETEQWFMSSITWHDFLLGCTSLCLILCSTSQYTVETAHSIPIVDASSLSELLRNCRPIFDQQSFTSKDTRKVRQLVEATISRFGRAGDGSTPTMHSPMNYSLGVASNPHGQAISTSFGEDWLWNADTIGQVADPTWAYLEQFLDLPHENSTGDT